MISQELDAEQCKNLLDTLWMRSLTGYALVSKEGKFKHANPTFCKLTEYTEAELKEKTFMDITMPSDLHADLTEAKMVELGKSPGYDMTKTYITKRNRFLKILLRVTGITMNGRFIHFVAEITPLDAIAPDKEMLLEMQSTKSRNIFLYYVKEYWVQILFGAGMIGYMIREAVK